MVSRSVVRGSNRCFRAVKSGLVLPLRLFSVAARILSFVKHRLAIVDTMAANPDKMIQSGIFEDLQRKIDEDTAVKDVSRPPSAASSVCADRPTGFARHCPGA